ncbi:MAG: crossover junction endodeoxyribonuclease RuvC [Acidobacteriota bacterium]
MRILGLDPGSRHTGYGFVDRGIDRRRLRPVAYGRLSPPRDTALVARLAHLASALDALLQRHAPDVAVLESLYHGVNPRALIVLAQARGALLTTLGRAGVAVHEYTPAEIKSAVTGSGRADKAQVARMVRLELGLRDDDLADDTTDALAVAICYAQRAAFDRLRETAR